MKRKILLLSLAVATICLVAVVRNRGGTDGGITRRIVGDTLHIGGTGEITGSIVVASGKRNVVAVTMGDSVTAIGARAF